MGLLVYRLALIAAITLTACAATTTTAHHVTLQAGNGDEAFYMVSDNVDPASLGPDSADIHTVASLPNGASKVCTYTLSQGVTWSVWTTGTAASTDNARAECQRRGQ
jgi:hypothetical protein